MRTDTCTPQIVNKEGCDCEYIYRIYIPYIYRSKIYAKNFVLFANISNFDFEMAANVEKKVILLCLCIISLH